MLLQTEFMFHTELVNRAVFTWLSKGIGFGFGFGFTTPFGWLVYLLWFWFYDSQVKTALESLLAYIVSTNPILKKTCLFHHKKTKDKSTEIHRRNVARKPKKKP